MNTLQMLGIDGGMHAWGYALKLTLHVFSSCQSRPDPEGFRRANCRRDRCSALFELLCPALINLNAACTMTSSSID